MKNSRLWASPQRSPSCCLVVVSKVCEVCSYAHKDSEHGSARVATSLCYNAAGNLSATTHPAALEACSSQGPETSRVPYRQEKSSFPRVLSLTAPHRPKIYGSALICFSHLLCEQGSESSKQDEAWRACQSHHPLHIFPPQAAPPHPNSLSERKENSLVPLVCTDANRSQEQGCLCEEAVVPVDQ